MPYFKDPAWSNAASTQTITDTLRPSATFFSLIEQQRPDRRLTNPIQRQTPPLLNVLWILVFVLPSHSDSAWRRVIKGQAAGSGHFSIENGLHRPTAFDSSNNEQNSFLHSELLSTTLQLQSMEAYAYAVACASQVQVYEIKLYLNAMLTTGCGCVTFSSLML